MHITTHVGFRSLFIRSKRDNDDNHREYALNENLEPKEMNAKSRFYLVKSLVNMNWVPVMHSALGLTLFGSYATSPSLHNNPLRWVLLSLFCKPRKLRLKRLRDLHKILGQVVEPDGNRSV